jgi:serine protease Do
MPAHEKKDPEAVIEIREALGAQLSVWESYLRRSIISTRTPYGFKISKIDPDSPASRAGWKKGDILLTWDNEPVKWAGDLSEWIRSAGPGAKVPFKIARRKKNISLFSRVPWQEIQGVIELKSAVELMGDTVKKVRERVATVRESLGVKLSVIRSHLFRSIISTRTPYGLLIVEVEADSSAARAGWRKGDILLTWNGRPVKSVTELLQWIQDATPGLRVPFELARRKGDRDLFSREPWDKIRGHLRMDEPGNDP